MTIFDLDFFEGKPSKYETNYLHMIIEGNLEWPLNSNTNINYGKFIHEYVHYIQHITTLFGIKQCEIFNNIFISNIDFCRKSDEIEIPLSHSDEHIKKFLSNFEKVKGDNDCHYCISDIEINKKDLVNARKNHSAVNIGIYDYENGKALEHGFKFGYTCIIETMAHLIQEMIVQEINHREVPYLSGIIIYKYFFKKEKILKQDKLNIITICYCALFHDNPAIAYFDYLDYIREHQHLTSFEIYKDLMNSEIKYKGEKLSIKNTFISFLEEYETKLTAALGCKLDYYHKVIENCKIFFSKDENPFLEMVLSGEIVDKDKVQKHLLDLYGIPYIEAHNYHYTPAAPTIETAALRGLEILMKRFYMRKPNTKCPWFQICEKGMFEETSPMTEECKENQWDKKERCLMTESIRYFRMNEKTFIQH